jgi:hypothetical protein
MTAKKKTKTNSSAKPKVPEKFNSKVEIFLDQVCEECKLEKTEVIEALLFDAWDKSRWEPKHSIYYKVNNARQKMQVPEY